MRLGNILNTTWRAQQFQLQPVHCGHVLVIFGLFQLEFMYFLPTGKLFERPGRLLLQRMPGLHSWHLREFHWDQQVPALSRRQLYACQCQHQLQLL